MLKYFSLDKLVTSQRVFVRCQDFFFVLHRALLSLKEVKGLISLVRGCNDLYYCSKTKLTTASVFYEEEKISYQTYGQMMSI